MNQLEKLFDRIIGKVNISLREFNFDAAQYLKYLESYIPIKQLIKFYAFYGVTSQHPFNFHFSRSNLAGSYFLGNCMVDSAILYKSDIRGDELKSKGDTINYQGVDYTLDLDEKIRILDSILIKTLVHANSCDPANPELFLIKNTASTPYVNIHGSSVEGCFLGPFATADLTRLYACVLGTYSYIQAGEMWKQQVGNGRIWIKNSDVFEFTYRHAPKTLDRYINFKIGRQPSGIFIDFIRTYKEEFQRIFNSVNLKTPAMVPKSASLNRYAVVRPKTHIGENVLVAQRAYLENSFLGDGANAQENCYIINSHLAGKNVTAHGAKIVHSRLAKNVFVGFNSFLRGTADCQLHIGQGSVVMPHTIIDLRKPVSIPADHLVWGYIQTPEDLKYHSLSLKKLATVRRQLKVKNMEFRGDGGAFVKSFRHRIQHILEVNGAYFDGKKNKGHAQREQNISFNIIQPYPMGPKRGLFPTLDIQP
ncbi:MAG: transferase [Deltaproteobacteria bacterium]|jgi:carbonic anhydrase/acetyltransferase-like protein (isoleucine patch superfamily)|nr:transferase [Deltaproteobacteria bacterium]